MFELRDLFPWAINSAASWRAPVPQSKIRRAPLAVVTSTGSIAAEVVRTRPWRGDRPPCSPETYSHEFPPPSRAASVDSKSIPPFSLFPCEGSNTSGLADSSIWGSCILATLMIALTVRLG